MSVAGQVGAGAAAARSSPVSSASSMERFSTTPLRQHDDEQADARAEADELHRADRGRLVRRADDDGGVVGEVGEELAGVVQHLLELAVGVVEEVADLLALRPASSVPLGASWSTKKR